MSFTNPIASLVSEENIYSEPNPDYSVPLKLGERGLRDRNEVKQGFNPNEIYLTPRSKKITSLKHGVPLPSTSESDVGVCTTKW